MEAISGEVMTLERVVEMLGLVRSQRRSSQLVKSHNEGGTCLGEACDERRSLGGARDGGGSSTELVMKEDA